MSDVLDFLMQPSYPDFNFDDMTEDEATDINPTLLASTFAETMTILQSKIQIQNKIIKCILACIRKL